MNWMMITLALVGAFTLGGLLLPILARLVQELWQCRLYNRRYTMGRPVHISKVCRPGQRFEIVEGGPNFIFIKLEDGLVRCVTFHDVRDGREDEAGFEFFRDSFWTKTGTYEFSTVRETNLGTNVVRTVMTVRPVKNSPPAADNLHGSRANRIGIAASN